MLKAAQIAVTVTGLALLVLGVLEPVYESLATGGGVLIGSALIAMAITGAKRT